MNYFAIRVCVGAGAWRKWKGRNRLLIMKCFLVFSHQNLCSPVLSWEATGTQSCLLCSSFRAVPFQSSSSRKQNQTKLKAFCYFEFNVCLLNGFSFHFCFLLFLFWPCHPFSSFYLSFRWIFFSSLYQNPSIQIKQEGECFSFLYVYRWQMCQESGCTSLSLQMPGMILLLQKRAALSCLPQG